jgi:hypothetical protein
MPMSITWTSPACALPGWIHRPGLAAWNVAVATARTAGPATSPVEASTPLGTSAATTGAEAPFSASMALAAGPRGAPVAPVPSSASTSTPACSSRAASNGAGGRPGSRRSCSAASPRSSAGSNVASTSTSRPAPRSRRAATRPSPPLLPFPHTITTRPNGERAATTRASPSPARSMRSSEGTPRSSIAQASVARIASASGSGSSQAGRLTPAPRPRPRARGCA